MAGRQRYEQRRTVVMSADAVGYSRWMATTDERWACDMLRACASRITESVRSFGGRVVDAPGDNLLAEFASEPAALECAIDIQRRLADHRARRNRDGMRFRIGLHSGEVLSRDGKLYGHVVNLAARFQTAAHPDGILLSRAIVEHVGAVLARQLEPLGELSFKNIPYPVAAFQVEPSR